MLKTRPTTVTHVRRKQTCEEATNITINNIVIKIKHFDIVILCSYSAQNFLLIIYISPKLQDPVNEQAY